VLLRQTSSPRWVKRQRKPRNSSSFSTLNCLTTSTLLVSVLSATAQHVHVHRMQGKDAAPDRQLECSSMILRPPVCLLLEIAACKSWSLGSTIGHDICQSAHKWCGLWPSIYSWLSLRQIARMQKGAQQASTETLESGRPRCLL